MCGRYRLSKTEKYLVEKFGVNLADDFRYVPRYNVAPTQEIPVIRQDKDSPRRMMSAMRWGLIPYWAKDVSIGSRMINARAESCVDKPAFSEALVKRRCLVPADGFYEWQRSGSRKHATKQPFLFTMKDDSVFAFAGIWERWKSQDGRIIESCSIFTTVPNEIARDVHDRMPVILKPEHYDLWLDPKFSVAEELAAMLRPYDTREMKKVPVSDRVNSPANDDPECATEVPDAFDQRLFR
jgi:putative SOS response-associated peptidase YedK